MVPKYSEKYCCEPIENVENYSKAAADTTQIWVMHHKKEIELNVTQKELKKMDLFYNRPAAELIYLTRADHMKLHGLPYKKGEDSPMFGKTPHNKGKTTPAVVKEKISNSTKSAMWRPEIREKYLKAMNSVDYKEKRLENARRKAEESNRIIEQYTLSGELVAVHLSLGEALTAIGKNRHDSHIRQVCMKRPDRKGRIRKSAYGFIWKYK